jgi:hypothetical protein
MLRALMKKKGKGKGKNNVYPRTGHEGPEGEEMYSSTLPLTLALDGLGGQRPGRVILGKDLVFIV